MKKVIVILSFSSFVIGTGKVNAQCDTLKDATCKMVVFDNGPLTVPGVPEIYVPPSPPDPNEVRRIYFIHGLGGDAKAWAKAAEACDTKMNPPISGFPARLCLTERPEYAYSSTISLSSAAKDIRTKINVIGTVDSISGLTIPRRSIIIAHSQGGLVTRELMHLDMVTETWALPNHGMNYGGVATFASPLQGAAILKNRSKIFEMVNDGCKKLAKGPEYEANVLLVNGKFPYLVTLAISKTDINNWLRNTLNNITESVCDIATNNIMPMFFKEYYNGITEDYNPGTVHGVDHINAVNQDTVSVQYKNFPKVAFYAVEPQDNIFWRTLNWMVYDPNGNNGANGPVVDYFGANDDWTLYNNVTQMIYLYKSKQEHYWDAYEELSNMNLNWTEKLLFGSYYSDATDNAFASWAAWSEGLSWFSSVNSNWQTIIGARKLTDIKPLPSLVSIPPGYSILPGLLGLPIYIGKYEVVENDGVVLAESAANLPYAQKNIRIYPNEDKSIDIDKGSSHMQVRNDQGLKEHLKKLLDGDYGQFFKVNEQP